ncbi:MAG: hypothetical protein JXA21_17130 [Anaerolineae bacterium]|nr:hypothetical protein [Anaerolineae bacterium]
MIKLEATLDADSQAAIDNLVLLLKDHPGASIYLRYALAQAIEQTIAAYTGNTWSFVVASSSIRPFVAVGVKEYKARKMRRVVVK